MNQSVSKAGFFPRLAAYLVDAFLMGILIMCLEMPVSMIQMFAPDFFLFQGFLFHFTIFDVIFYLITVAYYVLMLHYTGTTIGKRLFNLAVVDAEGKKLSWLNALYRETVGKYLSSFLCWGYIMIFIDKNNRAFHDYLCDTSVIYTVRMRQEKKTPKPMQTSSVPGFQEVKTLAAEEKPMATVMVNVD